MLVSFLTLQTYHDVDSIPAFRFFSSRSPLRFCRVDILSSYILPRLSIAILNCNATPWIIQATSFLLSSERLSVFTTISFTLITGEIPGNDAGVAVDLKLKSQYHSDRSHDTWINQISMFEGTIITIYRLLRCAEVYLPTFHPIHFRPILT